MPEPTEGQTPTTPDSLEGTPDNPTPETPQSKTFDESYVKDLRKEAAGYRTRAQELEKQLQQQETNKLAEKEEYKELWEKTQAKVIDLEGQVASIETLTAERDAALAVVSQLVEQEIKDAPEYVVEAIAERDPVAKLDFLNRNRDKWSRTSSGGIPASPRPNGTPASEQELINQEIARLRGSGRYGI